MKLENVDLKAVQEGESDFLLEKGAHYYKNKEYECAFELYHLASMLGNNQAMANLGYCYLDGKGVKKDLSLAAAYFEMAAKLGNVDGLYKLGSLYLSGVYYDHDEEMARYYLLKALDKVGNEFEDKVRYPSLYFLVSKEILRGELFDYDPEFAFVNLMIAKLGYEVAVEEGLTYYSTSLKEVNELAENPIFDDVKEMLNEMDDEDEDYDDDDDFLEYNPFM